MAEVRCLLTDAVREINLKIHTYFMSDRRQMQHTVGRASKRHIYGEGIQDRLLSHDIPWADVLLPQLHHLHACLLGKTDPCGMDSRNRSVAAKAHSKDLSQTVHTVRRIHTGTRTAGWAGLILEFTQILIRDQARRVRSYCLEHTGKARLLSLHIACEHRTAAYEDGRHIDPCRRHQKPRHILITVRHHHQRVKLVRDCHRLCRIRDQIPRYQRILHTEMSHGNPVAYGNGREYDRRTARHGYSLLYCIDDLVQVHVSRNDLIIGAYDPNQRTLHLLRCKP